MQTKLRPANSLLKRIWYNSNEDRERNQTWCIGHIINKKTHIRTASLLVMIKQMFLSAQFSSLKPITSSVYLSQWNAMQNYSLYPTYTWVKPYPCCPVGENFSQVNLYNLIQFSQERFFGVIKETSRSQSRWPKITGSRWKTQLLIYKAGSWRVKSKHLYRKNICEVS